MAFSSGRSQAGTALEAGEGAYAVASLSIDYRVPARLDDDLLVVSRVSGVAGATVRMAQQVMRGKTLLTQASVTVAFLSAQGRPKRQPRQWVDLFNSITSGDTSPQ